MGSGGLNGMNSDILRRCEGIDKLSDSEVQELYNHLKQEYEKKIKELTVRKMETQLVKQMNILNSNATKADKRRMSMARQSSGQTGSSPNLHAKRKIAEEKNDCRIENIEEEIEVTTRLLGRFADDHPELISSKVFARDAFPKQQVQTKALAMLGDEKLDDISRELVPKNAQLNKKALNRLGEEKILPERLQKRLGAAMTPEQLKAQKESEIQEEAERLREIQKRDNLMKQKQEATGENTI